MAEMADSSGMSPLAFTGSEAETFWVNYWIVVPDLRLKGDEAETKRIYTEIADEVSKIKPYKDGSKHLWNWEPFRVAFYRYQGVPCLFGTTRTLDCMWDEQSIIYILRELSKVRSDVYIRVTDNLGECLIQLGEEVDLPKWTESVGDLNNIVWLNEGQIKLIRPLKTEVDENNTLAFADALNIIANPQAMQIFSDSTALDSKAFSFIEESYPLQSRLQRVRLKLPKPIALFFRTHHIFGLGIFDASEEEPAATSGAVNKLIEESSGDYIQCSLAMTPDRYARIRVACASSGPYYNPESFQMSYNDVFSHYLSDLAQLKDMHTTYGTSPTYELQDIDKYYSELLKSFMHHMEHHVYGQLDYKVEKSVSTTMLDDSLGSLYTRLFRGDIDKRIEFAKIVDTLQTGTKYDLLYDYPDVSNEELTTWDSVVDSQDWFRAIEDEVEEEQRGDEEAQLVDKMSKFLENETGFLGVDDTSDSDSDTDNVSTDSVTEPSVKHEAAAKTKNAQSRNTEGGFFEDAMFGQTGERDIESSITEDDFFEFFAKEALHLPPEELEKLRAAATASTDRDSTAHVSTNSDELEESLMDQFIKMDLSSSGLDLDEDLGNSSSNLRQSMLNSNDPAQGPAAQLYRQLGLSLPRSSGSIKKQESKKQSKQ